MKPQVIRKYRDFWSYYLSEHSSARTRRFHVFGTILGISLALGFWRSGEVGVIWVGPVLAYGLAWYSHFFIEKNRPATFKYPFWSLISDFRMVYWVFIGRLEI